MANDKGVGHPEFEDAVVLIFGSVASAATFLGLATLNFWTPHGLVFAASSANRVASHYGIGDAAERLGWSAGDVAKRSRLQMRARKAVKQLTLLRDTGAMEEFEFQTRVVAVAERLKIDLGAVEVARDKKNIAQNGDGANTVADSRKKQSSPAKNKVSTNDAAARRRKADASLAGWRRGWEGPIDSAAARLAVDTYVAPKASPDLGDYPDSTLLWIGTRHPVAEVRRRMIAELLYVRHAPTMLGARDRCYIAGRCDECGRARPLDDDGTCGWDHPIQSMRSAEIRPVFEA